MATKTEVPAADKTPRKRRNAVEMFAAQKQELEAAVASAENRIATAEKTLKDANLALENFLSNAKAALGL